MLIQPACAERIFLKSGKIVSGRILLESEEQVKIDTGIGFPVTYFHEQIKSIDRRNFELDFAKSLSDEDIQRNVAQLILELQQQSTKSNLKDWKKSYQWHRDDRGIIVVKHKYKPKHLKEYGSSAQSAMVTVYYSPDELD